MPPRGRKYTAAAPRAATDGTEDERPWPWQCKVCPAGGSDPDRETATRALHRHLRQHQEQ